YPEGASGDATVVLTLTVNADGTVQSAVPLQDDEPFSSQAVGAALAWTFDAATRNGSPVAAKIRVEVIFREPRKEEAPPGAGALAAPAGDLVPAAREPPATAVEVTVRGERVEPSRSASL